MNYLKGKKVYLTGPIHSVADDGVEWRNFITPRLESMSIEILDPCKVVINGEMTLSEVGKNKVIFREIVKSEDWGRVKFEYWPIVRKDLRMVDHSDFLIFNYDVDYSMVGSIHELVVAVNEKKVILLKYDKSQLDRFNPWMATFIKENHFFSKWDDLFDYLVEVDSGKFDTSLWVI